MKEMLAYILKRWMERERERHTSGDADDRRTNGRDYVQSLLKVYM